MEGFYGGVGVPPRIFLLLITMIFAMDERKLSVGNTMEHCAEARKVVTTSGHGFVATLITDVQLHTRYSGKIFVV